ncbi:hypothetical protein DFH08DRAFT_826351 [Mycena albidolilacea]|uniref:Uncharacterized protein n=1 Tax=Mycena albidolilacea TaxID=1033008 RepID=A0AAD7E8F1_9AGAR|nr:hypothetical protein DFH08DRAFT_826351 [Mycena albidolilacea]
MPLKLPSPTNSNAATALLDAGPPHSHPKHHKDQASLLTRDDLQRHGPLDPRHHQPHAMLRALRFRGMTCQHSNRRRRTSISGHPRSTTVAASPPLLNGGAPVDKLEDERTQYVHIDDDIVPHATTQHKLHVYTTQWCKRTDPLCLRRPSPPHPTSLQPYFPSSSTSAPASTAYSVPPPTYALHAAAPAPLHALLTKYPSTIAPSTVYLLATRILQVNLSFPTGSKLTGAGHPSKITYAGSVSRPNSLEPGILESSLVPETLPTTQVRSIMFNPYVQARSPCSKHRSHCFSSSKTLWQGNVNIRAFAQSGSQPLLQKRNTGPL